MNSVSVDVEIASVAGQQTIYGDDFPLVLQCRTAAFQFGGLASAIIVFQFLESIAALIVALPIFGFLTLGMHAGFAVYFPELYPTRLRGTGTGFCFNAGRVLAAPTLIATGWLQDRFEYDLHDAATLLSLLFVVASLFCPSRRKPAVRSCATEWRSFPRRRGRNTAQQKSEVTAPLR
jgi:hypothetical protein